MWVFNFGTVAILPKRVYLKNLQSVLCDISMSLELVNKYLICLNDQEAENKSKQFINHQTI